MYSQIGLIICLVDETDTANVLHYSSIKAKRIAHRALAAELLAITHALDQASTLRLSTNAILRRIIHLKLYTDSCSLYECLVHTKGTTEKRLLIDLCLL